MGVDVVALSTAINAKVRRAFAIAFLLLDKCCRAFGHENQCISTDFHLERVSDQECASFLCQPSRAVFVLHISAPGSRFAARLMCTDSLRRGGSGRVRVAFGAAAGQPWRSAREVAKSSLRNLPCRGRSLRVSSDRLV